MFKDFSYRNILYPNSTIFNRSQIFEFKKDIGRKPKVLFTL